MKIGQSEELSRTVEAEEKAMLDLVTRADAGEDVSNLFPQSDKTGERSPDSKPASEELNPEQPTEQIQKGSEAPKAEDKTETVSKKDETTGKDPASEKPNPQDSKFQQAKKEQERRERSWKALNEQKEALRLEREAVLKEKAEALERAKTLEKQLVEARSKPETKEISAQEYEDAAKDYREDAKRLEDRGQFEEADKLLQKARTCEKVANQKRTEEKSLKENQEKITLEAQKEKFMKAWDENLEKLKKSDEYKELENPNSPLGLEVTRLIRDNPVLSHYPEGIKDAAQIAKWKMTAESLPGVLSKLAESEKKNAELASRMRIGASGIPELPKAEKIFEEMSESEMESHLASQSAMSDRG
jgi:hypothetical protein